MSISKDKTYINVLLSRHVVDFLHTYCSFLGVSISSFCSELVNIEFIKKYDSFTRDNVCSKCSSRFSCTMNIAMCPDVQDFYDEVKNANSEK